MAWCSLQSCLVCFHFPLLKSSWKEERYTLWMEDSYNFCFKFYAAPGSMRLPITKKEFCDPSNLIKKRARVRVRVWARAVWHHRFIASSASASVIFPSLLAELRGARNESLNSTPKNRTGTMGAKNTRVLRFTVFPQNRINGTPDPVAATLEIT